MNGDLTEWAGLDLDAYLAETDDYEPDAEPPDLDQVRADRYLRRLRHLANESAQDRAVAQAEHDLIDSWLDAREQRRDAERVWRETALRNHWRVWREANPGAPTKTLTFPSLGEVSGRALPDEWEFSDEFTAWAVENAPELLNEPKPPPPLTPNKAAAKKALVVEGDGVTQRVVTRDGEVVPGVTVRTNRGDKIEVRP